jgi:hypothetical protein
VTSTEPGPGDVNIGNRAGYVASMLREGMSANSILQTFKDLGAGMRRANGLKLIGQVRDSMAKASTVEGLRGDQLPDAAQYGTWAMGRGGQFATNVAVYTVERQTGLALTKFYTHVSNEPHTPEAAAQAAIDTFNDPDAASRYGTTVTGALPGMMYHTVPYQ